MMNIFQIHDEYIFKYLMNIFICTVVPVCLCALWFLSASCKRVQIQTCNRVKMQPKLPGRVPDFLKRKNTGKGRQSPELYMVVVTCSTLIAN